MVLKDLTPALPEGSTRNRRSTQQFDENDEQRSGAKKKKRKEDDEDGPEGETEQKKEGNVVKSKKKEGQQKATTDRTILKYKADGACRGNGSLAAKAAIGVWPWSYNSAYVVSRVLKNETTNQAAEISSAIELVKQVICESEDTGITDALAQMDSTHVVSTINSGRVKEYKKYGRHNNNALWVDLDNLLEIAHDRGINITWQWVPRVLNKEADELCNAALDGREIDATKKSPTTMEEISCQHIISALQVCKKQRVKAPRTLPEALVKPWIQFISTILLIPDKLKSRLLLWLAPQLLAVQGIHLSRKAEFKRMRMHIEMLQDVNYLSMCVSAIIEGPVSDKHTPTPVSERTRFHTMVKRGLFLKAIEQSNVKIADASEAVNEKLTNLFPTNELPKVLDAPQGLDQFSITYKDLVKAMRRMKSGKSPGFSGWTRELLWSIFSCATPQMQARLVEIFTVFGNVDQLQDIERSLFNDGILIPFSYIDKHSKLRPVILKETFGKIIWLALIGDVYERDSNFAEKSGQCFFRPGGSATASIALQTALQHHIVVAHDAKNAFNSFHRRALFEYLASKPKIYGCGYKWWNLQYSNSSKVIRMDCEFEITVTSGANQGCCSAGFAYSAAVFYATWKAKNISIVDDMYTIGEQAVENSEKVVAEMSKIGLDLTGEKTHLIVPDGMTIPISLPNYLLDEDGKPKVVKGLASPLGSVIQIGDFTNTEFQTAIKKTMAKAKTRCNRLIEIDGSKQDKLLVLGSMSYAYQYKIETCLVHGEHWKKLATFLDELHAQTAQKILGFQVPPASSVTLFLPTFDRGFGVLPYEQIGKDIRSSAVHRASPFIEKLGYTHKKEDETAPSALWQSWRQFSKVAKKAKGAYMPKSWLQIRPKSTIVTLSDEEVEFYARFLLDDLVPIDYLCPEIGKSLAQLPPTEFTTHMMTCRHCASPGFHERHNSVRDVLSRTLTFHCVSNTAEPSDANIPLKDGKIGRPDIRTHLMTPTYIDVAITKEERGNSDALKQRARDKLAKYSNECDFDILPFIMSSHGAFLPSSLEPFKQYAQRQLLDSDFYPDVIQNSIMALIKGMYLGYIIIKNRDRNYALVSAEGSQNVPNVPNLEKGKEKAKASSNSSSSTESQLEHQPIAIKLATSNAKTGKPNNEVGE